MPALLTTELGARRRRLEGDDPLLAVGVLPALGVHWVALELGAQVAFTEVTRDGKLRHPRFVGLRDDTPAHEVVLEGSE
jgi:ATP-dependent DNA ligase